ncbi:MAG TPA: SRPBCC domain-containing protein [Oligoflexia bacterium]|nr:SRPBCC domain-containing protein [Oligoflexia bacterium]HMR24652.1 SRPBCC domain-containing protein [Oligoflexia bacterium]
MSKSNFETANVQLINDNSVQVKRKFIANKDLVYESYTKPTTLKRWLSGYSGWEMSECEMEVNEGGQYSWRWRNSSENSEFGFLGKFLKVVPQQKIQHTQVFDPGSFGGDMGAEYIVTLEFSESNGSTLVTTTIQYPSKEDRDLALSTGMTDGMEINYKQLDTLLKI